MYSGYCCVTGFRNRWRKVTAKPLTESVTGMVLGCPYARHATMTDVTSRLRVAAGRSTFQPIDISLS